MNSTRAIIIIAVLLYSSGCASRNVWVHPTNDKALLNKDMRECKYDSQKNSFVPYGNGISPVSAGFQEGMQSVTLMNSCMTSRGYYLTNRNDLEIKNENTKKTRADYDNAMKEMNYPKALDIVNDLISLFPSSSGTYYARGDVYLELGKYNEAISDFNKSISLGHKNLSVYVLKSQAFIELGEIDVAIEIINQALALHNDAKLYNARSYALIRKGDYEKALEDCNRALALDASKPNAYKNRGLAYYGKSEYDKAIEQFNKSIVTDSTYAYAYAGRGETYLKTGKLENATSDFKKACELGDKDSCKRSIKQGD